MRVFSPFREMVHTLPSYDSDGTVTLSTMFFSSSRNFVR